MSASARVNVIGYASATIGAGVIAREFAKALIASGREVSVFDLNAGPGRSKQDLSLASLFVENIADLPDGINLWVTHGARLVADARQIASVPELRQRFHAAFVWWELPDIPPDWVAAAEVFDAVVTGSEFQREAWAAHVTHVPVLMAPTPLDMPEVVQPDRRRFGFKDDEVIVYTGFEALSDAGRKNPFAAVEAFARTAGSGHRARLVVKVNHAKSLTSWAQQQLQRLDDMVCADPRIVLMRESFDYPTLLQLYASVDIAISLHRSEGLGLMPLEAMRLGKPVVATGWSGNLTYMDHRNSALVRYKMTTPDDSAALYSPAHLGVSSSWAEPSVQHAADWLAALIADGELRSAMGLAAARSAKAYDAKARRLEAIEELQALASRPALAAPRQREVLHAKMNALCRQREDARLSPLQRQMRGLRRLYDRHLGWRLHRAGT
jgi:glycosyltransferase involved in cell wall biosynthesis